VTEPFAVTFRRPFARFAIARDVVVPLVNEKLEPESAVVEALVMVLFVAKKFPVVKALDDAYGNCEAATVEEEKNTP
jgi:hypothetical protein